MRGTSLLAIILATLAVTAAILGYALGALRTQREKTQELQRQIEANAARIGAHAATLTILTEDYDPPEETPEERRRRFMVIPGERGPGLLLPLAFLAASLRRHWRPATTAAGAAGAAAVIATALLAHGSPQPYPHAGVPPTRSATPTTASASPSAAPSQSPTAKPKPRRTPRVPAVPVAPFTRTRRPTAAASGAPSGPVGPSPPPSRPASTTSPTPSCSLIYVVALGVIKVCL